MFNFDSLNKSSKKTVRDGISTEGMEFKNLKDFVGQTLSVDGFFFTDSKYGRQVVVVASGVCINIPKRYTEDFEMIRDNDDALKTMMDGHLQLKDIEAVESKNGKTVAFKFATV